MTEAAAPPSGAAMQLKRYTIRPDGWEAYLAIWRRIAAIRRRCGFDVAFACEDRAAGLFTWAISHPRFAEGAARYYADPERRLLSCTDYDPATGRYSAAPDRAGPDVIEHHVLDAEIRFVVPAAG